MLMDRAPGAQNRGCRSGSRRQWFSALAASQWFHSTSTFYSFFGNLAGAADLNPLAKVGA